MPAAVTISTPSLSALWFSAGNVSRTMRIERMTSRGGSEPPTEAVDADHRVAAGHFHQLPHQLVGIVRERLDLLIGQLRRQRSAIRIGRGGLRVDADFDVVRERGDRELELLLVVAGAQPHIGQFECFEAGEFGLEAVAAWFEPGQRGHARVARGDACRGAALRIPRCDGDRGAGKNRAGDIDDRHRDARVTRGLGGGERRDQQRHNCERCDLHAWSFDGRGHYWVVTVRATGAVYQLSGKFGRQRHAVPIEEPRDGKSFAQPPLGGKSP